MKVGLYTLPVPPSVGGGFVLRDDVNRAAVNFEGRHLFELVDIPPFTQFRSRVRRKIYRTLGRPTVMKTQTEVLLRAEVERRKLDVLWFNHFEPVQIGVPYVLNIFDLQHRLQPWFPEVSANGEWESREAGWADAIRRAAVVTVGSQEAKEQLCHFYGVPLDNVRVLPFPTPQKAIAMAEGSIQMPAKQDVRSKYGIKNEFLFYPAQFWPHKNHINLLHALKILNQERGRAVSLVLTGSDHGNRPHVESVAKFLNLSELVHFCGFVPYEDVLTFYRDAIALSYLSFFGPENLPPLEAMALECPVILSDIPGVRALHGDGPVYVDPRSPQAIADAVEIILNNPAQMPGRIQAGKDVALRNNVANYLENFQAILDDFEPFRRCWP